MRFAGIDVASDTHVVAVVDETSKVIRKALSFGENAKGYARLREALGPNDDLLVTMEATGHYWKNLAVALAKAGYKVAVVNPLAIHRFGGEGLKRTKTDALDAVVIAQYGAQKRPDTTEVRDAESDELGELSLMRDSLVQDLGDSVRRLHRAIDLVFPEFTTVVKDLGTALATGILRQFPTAKAFESANADDLMQIRYDGRHWVSFQVANALVPLAKQSVGQHDASCYRRQVEHLCKTIDDLRGQIGEIDKEIKSLVKKHEVASLMTTIPGIGPQSAARIVAAVGDPSKLRSAGAFAAYVGAVPGLNMSGKKQGNRAGLTRIGNLSLRAALYMPTLCAIKHNPWLREFYERLIASGKLPKVALLAAMRKLLTLIYAVAKQRTPFVAKLRTNTDTPPDQGAPCDESSTKGAA